MGHQPKDVVRVVAFPSGGDGMRAGGQRWMGYEPGDPVRVVLPFDAKGKKLVREGFVVARVEERGFRIVFAPPLQVDGCEIEQAVVDEKHFV